MTRKELMLAAIRGEATPQVPYAPRLDLWYNANKRAGTLPKKYAKATLAELVDDLGWGYHAVIPDFRAIVDPLDDADRGLGTYNLRAMPVRTIFENVERRVRVDGERTHVEYVTPKGTIRTTTLYDESMKRAGITITHVEETAFKSADDYAALGWIFDNARVVPNAEGYAEFASRIGERGIAVGYISMAGSPMHLLLRDLMPFELFFYEMFDRPGELRALGESIGKYYRRLIEVASKSAAEVILYGANYDATTTNPRFFAEHITPWLRECAETLHARGKFLLTHTDGENTGLLDEYLKSRFDVADSICPRPMTKLTLKQVRDAFGGRIAIMGGVPSVSLLMQSMHDAQFGAFLDSFFADLGRGERLILGISDTTPPAAEFNRLVEIAKRVKEFGPVKL